MRLLDGKRIQDYIKEELKEEIINSHMLTNLTPHLAIVQVGNDSASNTYIQQKVSHATDVGMIPVLIQFNEDESEDELIETIQSLNSNPLINGIIIQLPLPKHFNEFRVIESITPLKDVDCLTSTNIGLLHIQKPYMTPCTPSGIIEILDRYGIDVEGKNVLVIGRSNIVGRPISEMLTQLEATVTLAHSKTKDLIGSLSKYDIIISAVGQANFIKAEDLRMDDFFYKRMIEVCNELNKDLKDVVKKMTVIDVGINRDENGKLCGDVDYKSILQDEMSFVSDITPVPLGVGRVTVAMLLKNVVKAFKTQNNLL